MSNGVSLAVAILLFFLAMICFFFAFHPGGVQGASDPDSMLQWLLGQYDATATGGGSASQ